jgi:selenocysteine lyase/cysteine desulfurase
MEWDKLYNQYPVNQERIWLNNAGTTPVGIQQIQSVQNYMEEYARHGIFSPNHSYAKIKTSILEILGRLMNVPVRNLALIHNTSEGMNFYSRGLQLKSKDKIYVLENEYPSNYYPWEYWLDKNVEIQSIPMQESREGYLLAIEGILRKDFLSSPGSERILSLSPVHWCTGIPLPMEEIANLCKETNSRLIIDGAQGVGHVPLYPARWGVDFLAGSAWKWLLGPLGLGILYISDNALERIDPVFKGTQSVPDSLDYLPYKKEIKTTADRYEFSTPSFLDWVYFESSLLGLEDVGFAKVQSRIYDLSNYLFQKCKESGIPTSWGDIDSSSSGILGISLSRFKTPRSAEIVCDELAKDNFVVVSRLGRLRVSPHIYNSKSQIDEFFERILREMRH